MDIRWAHVGAAVSILGFLAWLVLGQPDGETRAGAPASPTDTFPSSSVGPIPEMRERSGGSRVPCAVPLAWRLARVDEGFGYNEERARAAVGEAAALWEREMGRALFVNDPVGGFPIRFVYGDRQTESRRRRRLEEGIAESRRRLEERRTELDSLRERHQRLRRRFEERARGLEERVSRHNATVRSWNRRGEIPEPVARELQTAERELEEERRALDERREALDDAAERLRAREEGFRRRVAEHDQRARALGDAFPPTPVRSGLYREAVRTEDGRAVLIDREIRVYRFDDARDLRRVIAHELGHALGLGHTDASDALMNAEYGGREPTGESPVVREADVELLRARCPELGEGSGS